MADDRRREVEVGAGLQESRLNEEFIDGLKKHGPKVIYILAAVVLVGYGFGAYKKYQSNQKDEAFAQLEQVSAPDALIDVAEEAEGKASVSALARLDAANALMDSARARLKPGVTPQTATPEDKLTDEQVAEQYRAAAKQLEAVIAQTKGTEKHAILQAARWGLVTAKVSLGETEQAKKVLNEYVAFAAAQGWNTQAELGRQRLKTIEQASQPKMVTDAQVKPATLPDAPADGAVAGAEAKPTLPQKTPRGNKLSVEGQKMLDDLLNNRENLPDGWKRMGRDILIPVRDDEGKIRAYYTKSSYDRGAIDPRWILVLEEELRGNVEKANQLEEQILFEDFGSKKKPSEKPAEEAEKEPASSGG